MTITVALKADYYLGWAGGASLLGRLINVLVQGASVTGDRVIVSLDSSHFPDIRFNGPAHQIRPSSIIAQGVMSSLLRECPSLDSVHIFKSFPQFVCDLRVDIIGPSGVPVQDMHVPWTSFIPDFQHHYMPDFFSEAERRVRDNMFRTMVEHSSAVFVNSRFVESDVFKFYPGYRRNIKVFRLPRLIFNTHDSPSTSTAPSIPTPFYFISCSQRWKHKQHLLILNAFSDFLRRTGASDVGLVFTGEQVDYRHPSHAEEFRQEVTALGLTNRVFDVGFLDRGQQLRVMKGALALIQASLFEGGVGASGMIEAAHLNVKVIASDIPPNLEFDIGVTLFFDRFDKRALSDKLVMVYEQRHQPTVVKARCNEEEIRGIMTRASGISMFDNFKFVLGSSCSHAY